VPDGEGSAHLTGRRRAWFRFAHVAVPLVTLALGAGSSRADDAARNERTREGTAALACGRPGKPACPLQAWMRGHVAAPLATGNFDQLAQSFAQVAKYNPDPSGWKNWDRFASEGATAARERDGRKTARACTSCHDVYRAKYNAQHRERALP
jgi:hypothetical protein